MLKQYREGNPDDRRDDKEVLTDLMEHFVESESIKKKDGKYLLPEIIYDA